MRYFIARVTQSNDPGLGTYNTTACARYPCDSLVQVIPTDANGNPVSTWGLAAVNASDYSEMIADPDVVALPDIALSTRFGSLSLAIRTAILSALGAYGIDTGSLNASSTFKDVINLCGRRLNAAFDADRFWAK
jgi:hypothetical protein